MKGNRSEAKKRYENALKEFWELQQIDQTEEEKIYSEKLQELERLSQNWRDSQTAVQNESIKLLDLVQDYDSVKEEYDYLVNRYNMLKKLLKLFEDSE